MQPSQQHQGDNSADPSAAKTGYALFDLDQTLVPWDTQLLFCNYILKRMPLRRLYLLILIPFLILTKLLGAGGMKRVFLNYLVGLSRDELQKFAAEFVEQHLPHSFYGEMLELVEQQKKLGLIISGRQGHNYNDFSKKLDLSLMLLFVISVITPARFLEWNVLYGMGLWFQLFVWIGCALRFVIYNNSIKNNSATSLNR